MNIVDQSNQFYYNSGYEQGVKDTKEMVFNIINEPVSITVHSIHTNVIKGVIKTYKQKLKERIESALEKRDVKSKRVETKADVRADFINVFPYSDNAKRRFEQLDMGTRKIID